MKPEDTAGATRFRWASNLIPYGSGADRFAAQGYRMALNTRDRVRAAGSVRGLRGVELHFPDMVEGYGIEGIRAVLEETGLACAVVSPTISRPEFRAGALTNPDSRLRQMALDRVRRAMDAAAELGVYRINLWPGREGHDYPFQVDYHRLWDLLVDALRTCADHDPKVQICVEYKAKEPRVHSAVGGVGILLALLTEVGRPNVGGLLDVGHAFLARERPAEAAVLLARHGRLFHLHFNDTPGDWDWDLIPGASHTLDLIELLYWLQRVGYNGWYSLDLYPLAEDPTGVLQTSVDAIEQLAGFAALLDEAELEAIFQRADALKAQAVWHKLLRQGARAADSMPADREANR